MRIGCDWMVSKKIKEGVEHCVLALVLIVLAPTEKKSKQVMKMYRNTNFSINKKQKNMCMHLVGDMLEETRYKYPSPGDLQKCQNNAILKCIVEKNRSSL